MNDKNQSSFQALLTTGLAMALGATLMTVAGSNEATAYPMGAVSYGANPVFSVGGTVSPGDGVNGLTDTLLGGAAEGEFRLREANTPFPG